MAAITGIIFVNGPVPWPSATPGGLQAEIWRIPASTAADTQTLTAKYLSKVLYVIGPVSHTALTDNTAALITSVTVAASNFVDIILVGPRAV